MYKLDRERIILLASILHLINIRFTPLHLQRCRFRHQVYLLFTNTILM